MTTPAGEAGRNTTLGVQFAPTDGINATAETPSAVARCAKYSEEQRPPNHQDHRMQRHKKDQAPLRALAFSAESALNEL